MEKFSQPGSAHVNLISQSDFQSPYEKCVNNQLYPQSTHFNRIQVVEIQFSTHSMSNLLAICSLSAIFCYFLTSFLLALLQEKFNLLITHDKKHPAFVNHSC